MKVRVLPMLINKKEVPKVGGKMNKQERYKKRKSRMIELGATFLEEEDGFVAGICFFENDEVFDEDDEGFEETEELVRMAIYHEKNP